MICKSCPTELTDSNAYKQKGVYRGWCKDCWRELYTKPATKRYHQKNPEWLKASKLAYQHRKQFGGMRDFILERDGFKCLICGMTQQEHQSRWNRSLTIDHIDRMGNGVARELRNNDPNNLQTLCLPCHARKDNMRHQLLKTRCPQGHSYDEGNTYINTKGARVCRTCNNEASMTYKAKKRLGL